MIQIVLMCLGIYYFSISLFAFISRLDKEKKTRKKHSFALIVAAHNEEVVIGQMVDSLTKLNYPKEKYDIFVIADNCTDKTASLARKAGAKVLQRFNDIDKGKGFALEHAFAKLFKMKKQYDYLSVFDADNLVDKEFLNEMNKHACMGEEAIQGYIDSKNPTNSWISYSYSIAFWTVNKLFQQSRYNLRLGCQLCGTGFAVKTDLIKDIGWGATCLTEDMEFTMRLALRDIKVAWANDAKVYDEKPVTLGQSWKQRVRWMQGQTDVACRFVPSLFKKATGEVNILPLDCILYLLQPFRIIVMGAITFLSWYQLANPSSDMIVWHVIPQFIWLPFIIMQFLWGPLVLIVEKKFTWHSIPGFLAYIIYNLTWIPITAIGIAKKNQTEWFHTAHTKAVAIEEIKY